MPGLADLEILRQQKQASLRKRLRVALTLGLGVLVGLGYFDYHLVLVWKKGPPAATLIFSVLMYLWVTAPKRAYGRVWKKSYLPLIAQDMGLAYERAGGLTLEEIKDSRIVPLHHEMHCEDSFSGTWKGARLRFNEMHLQERRKDSRGKDYLRTVFKGLAILIDLPMVRFYGRTVVQEHRLLTPLALLEVATGLRRAGMVDVEFSKRYVVLTNDQTEARYLVHPALIARISDHAQVIGSKGLAMSFWDNKVLILLRVEKDLFEAPSLFAPVEPAGLRDELETVLGFIDYLSLYRPAA